MCGQEDFHDRRARAKRQAASAAGGVFGLRRSAVRLLHDRNDHVGSRSARRQARSLAGGNLSLAARPYLPLRNVCPDRAGGPPGGGERWLAMNGVPLVDPMDVELEPERYELYAEPRYQFALDRRDFC